MCGFYHQDERNEAAGRGCLALVLVAVSVAVLTAASCVAM
jgi:hypothetical protein